MENLNKRYDLRIGYLGKYKFFTLFDEKLECNVYQIKINGNKIEEYYPSFNIDNSKHKAKKTENRVVPKKVQMQIIDLAKQEIKEERIFLQELVLLREYRKKQIQIYIFYLLSLDLFQMILYYQNMI